MPLPQDVFLHQSARHCPAYRALSLCIFNPCVFCIAQLKMRLPGKVSEYKQHLCCFGFKLILEVKDERNMAVCFVLYAVNYYVVEREIQTVDYILSSW